MAAKNVVFCVLFLGIVFFASSLYASAQLEECGSYIDCGSIDCISYSRICSVGECHYSRCLMDYGMSGREDIEPFQSTLNEYGIETENAFGLKPILLFTGKLVLVGFIILLFIFASSIFGLKGFLKIVVAVFGVVAVIAALAFFFGGKDIFLGLLGFDTETGGYPETIRSFSGQMALDVQKRDITHFAKAFFFEDIIAADEYMLRGEEGEISIAIITDTGNLLHDYGPSLLNGLEKKEEFGKHYYYSGSWSDDVYVWKDKNSMFFIAGPKKPAKLIANILLSKNDTSDASYASYGYSNDDKEDGAAFQAPIIRLVEPENESYTNDAGIGFEVIQTDFPLSLKAVSVDGIRVSSITEGCLQDSTVIACSLDSFPDDEGWQWFSVNAEDTKKNRISKLYAFYYDISAPSFSRMPEDGLTTSFINLEFSINDHGSGIDEKSIRIVSSQQFVFSCRPSASAYICSIFSDDAEEGRVDISVHAQDLAGNDAGYDFSIFFDKTRPEIMFTEGGFTLYDNHGIEPGSLLVNNKRYELGSCSIVAEPEEKQGDDLGETGVKYSCIHVSAREVSVSDTAGNKNNAQRKKQRE